MEKDNFRNIIVIFFLEEVEIIEEKENEKINVKFVWELNEKFFLIVDFLVRIWEEKINGKVMNVRRKLFELFNVSFFLLFLVFEL